MKSPDNEVHKDIEIPFMELSRSERRRIAKKTKIFKGSDRKAWRMLTKGNNGENNE